VDNLKLEAEFKLQEQQEKIEELNTRLENVEELEVRIASATAEIEKSRQTRKALQDRVQALELEKSRLSAEVASWHTLEASVHELHEQFEAFQESYLCDIEKLLGASLEVQSALTQRQNGNLLQRIRLALMGRTGRWSKTSGDLGSPCTGEGETGRSEMVLDSGEEAAATESETSREEPVS
jgi:predicted nuclease with TOPRIM domain